MIYKVVKGPKAVEGDPCNLFETLINQYAKEGWRYHSMETITQTDKGGCLKQPTATNMYMLIFEKDE